MYQTKNLQIDILPIKGDTHNSKINMYIDGICYALHVSELTALRLVSDGIVKQVQGERHNENNELETFDFPNGIDSAGVKYTSCVFVMNPKKTNA